MIFLIQFKDLMPYALKLFGADLPPIISDTTEGKIVWSTLFCFLCLLPISLPRQLTALRFTGFVGFGISIFMVMTIFFLSFNHEDEVNNV
jgi:amino acid permease